MSDYEIIKASEREVLGSGMGCDCLCCGSDFGCCDIACCTDIVCCNNNECECDFDIGCDPNCSSMSPAPIRR